MKITVKLDDIEIVIDRPTFKDYDAEKSTLGSEWRKNLMKDTVLPTLREAVDKVKELHEFKNK